MILALLRDPTATGAELAAELGVSPADGEHRRR